MSKSVKAIVDFRAKIMYKEIIMNDKKVDNTIEIHNGDMKQKKNKQSPKNMWIGISTIVAAVTLVIVVVVVVVLKLPHPRACGEKDGEELNKCLLDESAEAYKNGGTDAVLKMYDDYAKSAKDDKEKLAYTINKVEGLNEVCDYSCSDKILETIDELAEMGETKDSIATICVFGVFYSTD